MPKPIRPMPPANMKASGTDGGGTFGLPGAIGDMPGDIPGDIPGVIPGAIPAGRGGLPVSGTMGGAAVGLVAGVWSAVGIAGIAGTSGIAGTGGIGGTSGTGTSGTAESDDGSGGVVIVMLADGARTHARPLLLPES